MAKIIYICSRNPQNLKLTEDALTTLARRLTPDHISSSVHTVTDHEGITFSIVTPSEATMVHGASVALGNIEVDSTNWWEPGAAAPEGAYALFRGDQETIELVSDIVASRSIWYVCTEESFIASTSQRAIIVFLRSYDPNPKVYPWVLSSGSLGPELSWDRRIHKMRGGHRVSLDRRAWRLNEHTTKVIFEPATGSEQEHERRLEGALDETFRGLNLAWKHWVLALSGGCDSRFSLVLLEKCPGLKCVTWGTRASLEESDSDAHIARQLADDRGLPHAYFPIDMSGEPIDRLFDRNLMAMEGRIDHTHAAMDGFLRYKQMHDAGIVGLIRSDEGFGWVPVVSKVDVRESVGLKLLGDFANSSTPGAAEMESQEVPDYLRQRAGESLATWRDRLYHEFRIPVILAALAEGRLGYLEQANPLLSRRVIRVVRTLPDHLRTNKILFRRIVNRLVPDVPTASRSSTLSFADSLSHPKAKGLFLDTLGTQQARALLPAGMLDHVLSHITAQKPANPTPSRSMASRFAQALPASVSRVARSFYRQYRKPILDPIRLMFRCFHCAYAPELE